jgi:AcrR family transcriptional regulator
VGEPRKTAGDRREALVETATALLIEQGLTATRTRDVTARAGVGVGLLNHYFSWTDLRALALGRALAQTVERVLPETPGDPGARLEVFLATSFAEATDPFWRLWIEAVDAAMTDPAVAKATETAARALHARLAGCLAEGDAAGLWSCADAEGAALRILAAQDGFSGFVLCGVPRIARHEAEAQLRHVVALECGGPGGPLFSARRTG